MANTDNSCSHLQYENVPCPQLNEMLELQKSLQERISPGFYSENESIDSIAKFFLANKHALEDELGETLDALGGIHDGIGNSSWKWWKANNKLAKTMTINDLSTRDLLELKMEIVDQFHFFMNQMIKVGMTGDELFNMYMSKNQENVNRQEQNY